MNRPLQGELFGTGAASGAPQSVAGEDELNPAQWEAVRAIDGPVLVIAGAGSGKTRTLVYRVAHLIRSGVAPERILLLTFTRKSAQEMLERAATILDDSCTYVVGGTFHAVGASILRLHGHHLGYTPRFTILDRGDSEGIVNLIKSSLDLQGVGKRFPSKRVLVNIISQMVNRNQSLSEVIESRYWHLAEFEPQIAEINEQYHRFKREHNLMDYDDLLVNMVHILDHPEAGPLIRSRFSHIMVDEYQDTNPVQAAIIKGLAREHHNVMVVGDDAQSIYSFRGADFKNIMEFPNQFPGARLIKLEENYRSTQPILDFSNAIIEQARERFTKNLYTSLGGTVKPRLYAARHDGAQAAYVAGRIREYLNGGGDPREVAVLFRSGFHSYKLELECGRLGIDYEKRGGLKLTESAHIKDVLCFLRVLHNPDDRLAWNRVLLMLEKVGPKTAAKVMRVVLAADDPIAALAMYKAAPSWKKGCTELALALSDMRGLERPLDVFDRLMSFYQDIFERIYHDDYPTRGRDLEQLRTIIGGYRDLESFLNDAALDPPEANAPDLVDLPGAGRVVLSTIHSAKGLEWDLVFIIHLVEGKFPSAMAKTSEEIEEERRLLYVAATRARKELYLVYPREVANPGRFEEPAIISRFLADLPPGLVETANRRLAGEGGVEAAPHAAPPASPVASTARSGEIATGSRVRHPFFGAGTVGARLGPRTVRIAFDRHGEKTINLDYVSLTVL